MKIKKRVHINSAPRGARAVIEFRAKTRKGNPDRRTVDLDPEPDRVLEFSFTAEIFDAGAAQPWTCGQCQERIAEEFGYLPGVGRLLELWKEYHLNGQNAGTVKQSKIIDDYRADLDVGLEYEYLAVRKYLSARGMLIDRDYQYGSAWLLRVLTGEDMRRVFNALAIVEAGDVMKELKL